MRSVLELTQLSTGRREGDIDVNAKSEGDWTPLHYAAQEGHNLIVYNLLEHRDIDANAKSVDEFAVTPLHLAAQWGHKFTVQCLLKHRQIDVNARKFF